jgi:STE24 endopeptidase
VEGGEAIMMGVGVAVFLWAFGFVSRRFERQADVFAARVMEREGGSGEGGSGGRGRVGKHGATLFASALERVAVVNNIPVGAWSWCHGSIGTRMKFLEGMSGDAERTPRFDRGMRWLYWGLVAALVGAGVWTAMVMGWER